MHRKFAVALLVFCVSLAASTLHAEDPPPASPDPSARPGAKSAVAGGDKQVAGMSILGNDEAPKSLVIVPWKSSDLGSALAVAKGLDAGREPVDRKVFGRAVDYYEIRAGRPN